MNSNFCYLLLQIEFNPILKEIIVFKPPNINYRLQKFPVAAGSRLKVVQV